MLSERPARGLTVCAQEQRLGVLGLEIFLNERGPQPPGRPQLGDFHVEIHANTPEERQPEQTHEHVKVRSAYTRDTGRFFSNVSIKHFPSQTCVKKMGKDNDAELSSYSC